MSGDAEQEYFVDGMVEDIITGLSRIKWLFVIARNSSFTYKGRAVDIRQVGRELGVRYVLEGGVRKAGNRLRITAQLIEAETGAHLWADKFDGAVDDLFELQDQITDKVIGIVEPSLQRSEIERARQKRQENLQAYDFYLRALPLSSTRKLDDAKAAAELLESALQRDPNYAAAHALLAMSLQIMFIQGGSQDADKIAGLAHARAAIAGSEDDAATVATAANVIAHLGGDHATAIDTIKNALAMNPSSATANYNAAHIYQLAGDYVQAALHADRALRLSPRDPLAFQAFYAYGFKAMHEGRYGEAASWFAKGAQVTGGAFHAHFAQAACLALAGSVNEGRAIVKQHVTVPPSVMRADVFSNGNNARKRRQAQRRRASVGGAGIGNRSLELVSDFTKAKGATHDAQGYRVRLRPDGNDVDEAGAGATRLRPLPPHDGGHGESGAARALESPGRRKSRRLERGLSGLQFPGRLAGRGGLA